MSRKSSYSDNIDISKGITNKEKKAKKQNRRLIDPFWTQGIRVLLLCLIIDCAVVVYIKYVKGVPVSEGLKSWVISARDFFNLNEKETTASPQVTKVVKYITPTSPEYTSLYPAKSYPFSENEGRSGKKTYT